MVKVGSMRRAKRILLMASVLVVSLDAANASWFRHKADAPKGTAPTVAGTSLKAIDVDASRVVLRTSGTPAYTSYSPAPDVFVVDLSATKGAGLAVPASLPAGVASVVAEEVVEMGTRLTRVTFRLSQPGALQTVVADNSVIVNIPAPPAAPAPAAPAVAEQRAEVPHVEPIVEPARAALVEPVASVEPLPAVTAKARSVKRVETSGSGSSFQLTITGDGAMKYKAFTLDAPARLVIDLEGLKNGVARPNVNVADALVKSIRVGQFKAAPDPVARIVVDLARKSEYKVLDEGDHLRVVFGAAAIAQAQTPKFQPVTPPSTASVVVTEPARPAATRASSAAAPADIPSQIPVVAENAAWRMPEGTATPRRAKAKITSPGGQTAPVTTKRTTIRTGVATTAPASENVFETPAATDMSHSGPQVLSNTPGGRTLSGNQKVYSGEPISLNLKDADLKDVLRTFGELTGLNIAIDPNVSGVVTVNFTDVPWDQALELILRQNNLTYVLEGNVMRVGTVDRIASEAVAQRKLEEENRLNVPMTTVVFKLSYAKASDVMGLAKDLASPRARIIVDVRTNQLIVSEVPQGLAVLRNLIETVDMPTRQVMIEARIVEASKNFSQSFGVNWAFHGALDPATGNGTGLIFPNRVGYAGGPFNFGGPGNILGLTLTDILGTFNLDFALNAAELEDVAKVISSPKVTTQDNQIAEIMSGTQLPVQTRVNFTTTVTYINATLTLTVTPQITEAGTIIMDISVSKNEPGAIDAAGNYPINTRNAKTRLMVRDGGTAVIGGIYQVRDTNSQSRIPFVKDIPVLGNLFKTHSTITSHNELLIFITPRIVRGT
jgi:type IV pilus assembly protein PilQ